MIIFAFLIGALAAPSNGLTCPKASLEECLSFIPSSSSCDNVTTWLRFQNSPLSSQHSCVCDEQRKAMEIKCKDNCPPASCLMCFEKIKKAVSECRAFYAKLKDVSPNCDLFKSKLIRHCAQTQICPACRDSYCQNGGVCHVAPTPDVTSCKCPKGFTGVYCQTSLCDDDHKCENGGTCAGANTCSCPADFTRPQCTRRKLGTAANPAPNASSILDAGDSAGSGLYWIQPPGEPTPALTYCDMSYQGGGWMLASYGFVHDVTANNLNRAIPNMNNPMGYLWRPDGRSSANGLVNLTNGAVMMARAATHMIMAAGGNPNTGGIDSYSYVYRIDLRQNKPYTITFANHNRHHGATGGNGIPKMHMSEFLVEGLKGETGLYLRYALAESLGITWGDSFPTGYGFYPLDLEYGTFNQGPFFPSVHSGDGHACSASYDCKIFQPDVIRGSEIYVHRGWYSAENFNQKGQTSIWFK